MMVERRYLTENLWTILEENGQKMTWLATKAGVSRSLLYLIKRGEWPITQATAEKIAAAMRLPVESIFFLADASTTSSDNRSSGSEERVAD